jgi:nitroreductase
MYMELVDAIKSRRSIRAFKREPVPDDVVRELLELGNLAPSAGNLQGRDFVVVRDSNIKLMLCNAALGQRFIADAPVVIVVCANKQRSSPYGARGRDLYCIQDADAAIENILLAVTSKGLGACWVGAFNETQVADILKLPSHIRPIALLPIGYPDESPSRRSRIPLSKLVHHEKW